MHWWFSSLNVHLVLSFCAKWSQFNPHMVLSLDIFLMSKLCIFVKSSRPSIYTKWFFLKYSNYRHRHLPVLAQRLQEIALNIWYLRTMKITQNLTKLSLILSFLFLNIGSNAIFQIELFVMFPSQSPSFRTFREKLCVWTILVLRSKQIALLVTGTDSITNYFWSKTKH